MGIEPIYTCFADIALPIWVRRLGTDDRIQTCNQWIRSPSLYSLSYIGLAPSSGIEPECRASRTRVLSIVLRRFVVIELLTSI